MTARQLAEHLDELDDALTFCRKLEAVAQAHLVGDEEGVDTLLSTVDPMELKKMIAELGAVVLRLRLARPLPRLAASPDLRLAPQSPLTTGAGTGTDERELAPVVPLGEWGRKA